MKIENKIYFAPGIEFKSVDWNDHQALLEHFKARVYAYYIIPAQRMSEWLQDAEKDPFISLGIAFGNGVIGCTTIDFLARVELNTNEVGSRYTQWLKKYIPEMDNPNPDNQTQTIAYRFYDEFRNGVVHEGHIKNAGQFSLDADPFYPPFQVFAFIDHAMVVHPFNLLKTIEAGLHQLCGDLQGDPVKLANFALNLKATFQKDIDYSIHS